MIDDNLSRRIIISAAISGASGIALGALGAHGLESILQQSGHSGEMIAKRIDQFDVGVRYHLVHAVALLALASMPYGSPASRHWICRLFVLGLILFSGSLYLLVLTDTPILGAVTPIGGLCWIIGWLLLLLLVRRSPAK